MVRLLIRLGWGILPSLTIASNRLGETPTYAAASDRDNPRGGRDNGNIAAGGGAACRVTSLGSRNETTQGRCLPLTKAGRQAGQWSIYDAL